MKETTMQDLSIYQKPNYDHIWKALQEGKFAERLTSRGWEPLPDSYLQVRGGTFPFIPVDSIRICSDAVKFKGSVAANYQGTFYKVMTVSKEPWRVLKSEQKINKRGIQGTLLQRGLIFEHQEDAEAACAFLNLLEMYGCYQEGGELVRGDKFANSKDEDEADFITYQRLKKKFEKT